MGFGIEGVLEAAGAIATGQCHTVLMVDAQAGEYVERDATSPWTRPRPSSSSASASTPPPSSR